MANVRRTTFYVDVKDPNGKKLVMDCSATTEEGLRDYLENEGYTVNKIIPKRGHHLCGYCGAIVNGTNKDVLCEDCQDVFGHTYFHEL